MKYTFFIILTVGLLSACVTKKSRADLSKVGQFYHNVTAKYNGWFNANELVEASILRLEQDHLDNYNEILPIYEYVAVESADGVKADLDEAIKKVSVVVTLHEFSDWADDSYLLIGKSMYLKQDYEAAENAFEFYMDEFLPNGKRATIKNKKNRKLAAAGRKDHHQNGSESREANKRKKELERARKKAEKERKAYNKELRARKKKGKNTDDLVRPGTEKAPDGTVTVPLPDQKKYEPTPAELKAKAKAEGEDVGLLGHQPVYDEAILWLAKTYIERENWTAADFQFRRLEADNEVPPNVYEELPVARAYYHMERENYPQVIPFLEQAIERASKRANKARYSYIVAQLYDKQGDISKAQEFYQKSLDFTNQYDMEFNTQLSIIRSGVRNKTLPLADAEAQLEKMLKDDRNTTFKGRIYYTLADLSLQQDDIPGAIAHLENSVANVANDPFQAVESQYLLATLYMKELKYVEAEDAFKATVAVMKETDARYKFSKKMADNLRDIAVNIETINLQDSLIVLSFKTDEELKVIAKELKKAKQKEAEELAAKSKYVSNSDNKNKPLNSPAAMNTGVGPQAGQAGSTPQQTIFWAFDTKNLRKTRREFDRTWGDIPLTDYWRVSSKASQFASQAEVVDEATGEIGLYESEIENFFKDVPKNDSSRAITHTTKRKAMLVLGQLYRDRLEDFDSSIKILEDLLNTYPDAPEKLETYYQLYLSALSAGDHARADKYKNLIITNFPNSRFAKVLSDPNYAKSQQSEQQRLVAYYDETYGFFEVGDHLQVLERIRDVGEKFGVNNSLMAKFELLKAMSLGAQVGKEAYVDGLKEVIAKYPNTPEDTKARDILLLLGDGNTSTAYGETGLSEAKFTKEDNALHFVVVYVLNQEELSLQDTKVALAKFHNQYFQLDNLKMASLVFDPAKNHSLVLVRSFTTKEKAMKYFETAKRNPTDFLPSNAIYEIYPITQKNYREVIKARSLDNYKEFFEANY
ncbi:MAG: tetratricopeptide repeat protein [Bacteroidota bacterium]|nr:tetratricopeptide repeat protein [Bacteroidota bacterium]